MSLPSAPAGGGAIETEWHIITPEYPPRRGGVSDYTHLIATGLAAAGDRVHVWCPPLPGPAPETPGVMVHAELGGMSPLDLRRVGAGISRFPRPRRLLIQWVPQGFGYGSLNVGFAVWAWDRGRKGDRVEVMVHEPFVAFGEGGWKQNVAAVVHRAMVSLLLRAASRIWVSIPAWESLLRRYTFGRDVPIDWLPVPSNMPTEVDPAAVAAVRDRFRGSTGALVGHFGTYGELVTRSLNEVLRELLSDPAEHSVLLLGRGSEDFGEQLARENPALASRIHVVGALTETEVAAHLKACDLAVQTYVDGISSRRTSAMAALALGVPVLATHGPLTCPIWEESGAVALWPVGDLPGLAREGIRLLGEPAERAALGARGQMLYRAQFATERVVERLRGP